MHGCARSFALCTATLALTLAACGGAHTTGSDAAPDDGAVPDGIFQLPPAPDAGPPVDAARHDATPHDTAHPDDAAPPHDVAPQDDATPLTCATGAYSCSIDGGTGYGYCCGALCIDTNSDHDHCGNCTTACAAADVCINGYCMTTSCGAPAVTGALCQASPGVAGSCCDGVCRDPSYFWSSATDCNGCGLHCSIGATCVAAASSYYGECMRGTSADYCGYQGATCPTGTVCASGQSTCLADSCGSRADMYLCALTGGTGHCCNGACTNTEFDRTNCGTCGTVCAAGTWCNYGTCVAQVACDPLVSGAACEISSTHSGRCCGGSCVDPTTDATNCSQCGNVCPLGATCVDASCEKADGTTASCHTDGCPAGLLCNYYACWSPTCAPGASGGVCAFGPTRTGTCCDGACVDVQQDEANCGQCGNGCSGGLCVGGTCFSNTATTSSHQTCSGYYDTCPANERCDPISDQCVNCSDWGYGDFCYSPMQCSQGRCVVTTCSNAMPGTEACADTASTFIGICCGGYFNPQCANIMTDTSNCGECDRKCPTGATCVGGECSTTPPACAAGHHAAYCALDGGAANVCCTEGCVDLTRTDTSCGGCGYACSAGLSCVGSSCIALACTTALEGQSCGRDGGNGTCCSSSCVDRETDATNCGSCGHVCSATMTCKGGGCGLDACDASHVGSKCHFTDTQLGLCCPAGCVDTTSDSQNCGGCGAPCPGSTTCQNGACHA